MADTSKKNDEDCSCNHTVDTLTGFVLRHDLGLAAPSERAWTQLQDRIQQPPPERLLVATGHPSVWASMITFAPRLSSVGAALMMVAMIFHSSLNGLSTPAFDLGSSRLLNQPPPEWARQEHQPPEAPAVAEDWYAQYPHRYFPPTDDPTRPLDPRMVAGAEVDDLTLLTPVQALTPEQMAAGGSINNPRKYWYVGRSLR